MHIRSATQLGGSGFALGDCQRRTSLLEMSLPGLTRQSIAWIDSFQMDARIKSAHDREV
jgi:hypothetical protein